MRRLLLCLPLCALPACDLPRRGSDANEVSAAAPLRAVVDDGKKLPDAKGMEKLARTDPIAFLEACVRRYDREVKGYTCTLQRQERVGGKLQPTEVTDCAFREKPFSVWMSWTKGAGKAQKLVYVKGQNGDKILIRPTGLLASRLVVSRGLDDDDVKKSTRYPPHEFGVQIGTQRALEAWVAAKKRGELEVKYLGEMRVKEAGGRPCWVLKRTGYKKPEDDGITESTFYFDKETWLQVGTLLKGEGHALIGEYFFRDVELNPEFGADTFTRKAL